MPILTSPISFIGSIDNFSAYRVRGDDRIILRRRGGPSAAQVKRSPAFENTRKNNLEFGGRSMLCKQICLILRPLKFVSDYNIAGPLNAVLKSVQELDTDSPYGERSVLLSKNPSVLSGFSLNRRTTFDTIVRPSIAASIDPGRLQVKVTIPPLLPGVNFETRYPHSFYSLVFAAGLVHDIVYSDEQHKYTYPTGSTIGSSVMSTQWRNITQPSEAETLSFDRLVGNPGSVLIVAAGIRFGGFDNQKIEAAKYVGAGKIIISTRL